MKVGLVEASFWLVKPLRIRPVALCNLLLLSAVPTARASSAAASCQAEVQRMSGVAGAEGALRACLPLFHEPACQGAWVELLDSPRASPGYGRGAGLTRLAEACQRVYCRLAGMGRQPLCTAKAPPPLSAEFFAAWRTFQTEVLRPEHVSSATSDRLVQALQRWAGFVPRPGTRHVLQAIVRPDVPGVVALTLWSARGERLGAWVTVVELDEATLLALQVALPPPAGATGAPCVRLEVSPTLPPATTEALLQALRGVCPAEVSSVSDA